MSRANLGGVRTNVYLPKPQHAAIETLVAHTGLTFAEHIRRAVDFYIAFSEDIHKTVSKLAEHENAKTRPNSDGSDLPEPNA